MSVAAIERPDLVVVGQPADLTAADTVLRLSRLRPAPPIVALLAPGQEHVVGYLVALGARGIALRSGSADDLAAVVGSALKGEQHVVSALHGALAGAVRPRWFEDEPNELLSLREREVLACLAAGLLESGDRGEALRHPRDREVTPGPHLRQARGREPQRSPRPGRRPRPAD